jgi:polyhydroxyalkanoate synthesis regulator phasin
MVDTGSDTGAGAPQETSSGVQVRDLLEKAFLLGVGAATITFERAGVVVDDFVKRGHISAEEGRKLAEEVSERSREEISHVLGRMQTGVESTYRDAGLATKRDYEDLDFRIRQLEHRVRLLEESADAASSESAHTAV